MDAKAFIRMQQRITSTGQTAARRRWFGPVETDSYLNLICLIVGNNVRAKKCEPCSEVIATQ